MDETSAVDLAERFLAAPPFRRERPKAYLYVTFSPKLNRRIHCYTHLGYDLCVHLETASDIVSYNERPPIINLGPRIQIQPAAVSRSLGSGSDKVEERPRHKGAVTVHLIDVDRYSELEDGSDVRSRRAALYDRAREWTTEAGFRLCVWSESALRGNSVLLENRKRLLAWLRSPLEAPPFLIMDRVDAVIRNVRSITIAGVLGVCNDADPDEVLAVLALRIIGGEYLSDIGVHQLGYATQMSAYHEFK